MQWMFFYCRNKVELMMCKKFRVCHAVAVFSLAMSPTLIAQTTVEKIDTAIIDKIKEEGLQRSKVMESNRRNSWDGPF